MIDYDSHLNLPPRIQHFDENGFMRIKLYGDNQFLIKPLPDAIWFNPEFVSVKIKRQNTDL